MPDIHHNLVSGTLTDNPLLIGATTANSANFASLPTVAAPDTLRITLDPDGAFGVPEIVLVTTHTAAATVITITRAQETANGGGPARAHPLNTVWRHSATRATHENLPYRLVTTKGDLLVASADKTIARLAAGANTTRLVADSTAGQGVRWAPETEQTLIDAKGDLIVGTADNTAIRKAVGTNGAFLVADSAGAGGVTWNNGSKWRRVANQSIPSGAATFVIFDTEDFDDLNTTWATDTVTIGTTGAYVISGFTDWAATPGASLANDLIVAGATALRSTISGTDAAFITRFGTPLWMIAGDTLKLSLTQNTGSAINVVATLRLTYLGG